MQNYNLIFKVILLYVATHSNSPFPDKKINICRCVSLHVPHGHHMHAAHVK